LPNGHCLICDKYGVFLKRHLVSEHSDLGYTDENVEKKYREEVLYKDEDLKCPYCGKDRKPHPNMWYRLYDTCASPECITLYSRKGAINQIEMEGGVEAWHKKRIDAKNDHGDPGAGLRALNKYKLDFYKETGYRTESEKILGDRLTELNIDFVYQPRDFYHSHSNKYEYCFIPDFKICDNIIVEVDGWYHECNFKGTDQEQIDYDRTKYMESLGYKVLRVTNEEVNDNVDEVINKIKELISTTREKSRTL